MGFITSAGTVRFEVPTRQKFSLGGGGTFEVDAAGTLAGRFLIAVNGNVGIGSTSPARRQGENRDGSLKKNNNQRMLEDAPLLKITC